MRHVLAFRSRSRSGRRRDRPGRGAAHSRRQEAAAAGDGQPPGQRHHRGSGGHHDRRTDVPQPHRPATSKPRTSSRFPRGPAWTSSPCGWTARRPGGELLDAKKANKVYTDIVRRTQDPGLLEYIGNNLMRLRVFPIPPHGRPEGEDQLHSRSPRRTAASSSTSIRSRPTARRPDAGRVLGQGRRSSRSTPIQNIYSPTHAITITRNGDQEVTIDVRAQPGDARQGLPALLRLGDKDIGLTPLLSQADLRAKTATSCC